MAHPGSNPTASCSLQWLTTVTLSILASLASTSTLAQQAPKLGYVFPAGGSPGSNVKVQLGGYDWTSDMETFCPGTATSLTIDGPGSEMLVPEPPYWFGAKANSAKAFLIPREFPATFRIPENAPAGPVYWQAANANGTTACGIFVVSSVTEMTEQEHRLEPQALPELPIVVNGRISSIEEVDRYTLKLSESSLVSCNVVARQLGSPLNATVSIHDQTGRLVTEAVDSQGIDTQVTFFAIADQQYTISLHDLDFRGNRAFVYRLNLSTGPRVLATRPAVVQRGSTTEVEFIGVGLRSGTAVLERVKQALSVPADLPDTGFEAHLVTGNGTQFRHTIETSDCPELNIDFRPDNSPLLSIPSGITSEFNSAAEIHRFRIAAESGDHIRLSAQAWRFGATLDLALQLLDPTGHEVAVIDDMPHTVDPELHFKTGDGGEYTVVVSDNSMVRGTTPPVYRLSVERIAPSFKLTMPQTASIVLGEEVDLPIKLQRNGGFDGAVTLTVDGLPEGVTAPLAMQMGADTDEMTIRLKSDGSAAVAAGLITVSGTANIDGRKMSRQAVAMSKRNPVPRVIANSELHQMLLAVTMKPRAEVTPADTGVSRTAHRGTTYPAKVQVKRKMGFTGPVTIRMSAYQQRHRQGMNARDVIIPPNADHGEFLCYLPEWLETNRTSRMRMTALTNVADPQGNVRQLVSYQDAAVSLSLEGALLKITHAEQELRAAPGEAVSIPVSILRSAELKEAVKLELIVPRNLAGTLKADSVIVPPGKSRTIVTVQTGSDTRLNGTRTFTIRGTAKQHGKYPVVSQTEISVWFGPTTELASP